MPELKLSGYVKEPAVLDDAQAVRQWMVDIASLLGMHIVNGPTVHSFKDSGMPEAGLSAYCIIAESHIAFHSWPELGFLMIQVVSCRPFDTLQAISHACVAFGIEEITCEEIDDAWGRVSGLATMEYTVGEVLAEPPLG